MDINKDQLNRMKDDQGFIAALDQSGGSTPAVLARYGIDDSQYKNEEEMFELVHKMRTRIVTNISFDGNRILGAILFKHTMRNRMEGLYTADYLWQRKNIVPFLKIDNGLSEENDGVQLMKPIPELNELLTESKKYNIFGTKMRSVIKRYDEIGIQKLMDQQFDIARTIFNMGLIPIIEPEVDINSTEKEKIEIYLRDLISKKLDELNDGQLVMLKLTIPERQDFYSSLMDHSNVVRIVALSGGYSREEANRRLSNQHGLIASFNRALAEGLDTRQSDEEFTNVLNGSIDSIYMASTQ